MKQINLPNNEDDKEFQRILKLNKNKIQLNLLKMNKKKKIKKINKKKKK